MFLVLTAAAIIDLAGLPDRVAGAYIGYEMCVSVTAQRLAKSNDTTEKLFEVAKLACGQDGAHFEAVFDNEFVESHLNVSGPAYDQAFNEHQKQLDALNSRLEQIFAAHLRNARSK